MAKHAPIPDEIKVFIINALAAFDTPSQVVSAVKEEFGVEVSRQAVEGHDPNKHAGRNLSTKWRDMFETARAAFINEATSVPIAHRSTRLRALYRMAQAAEKKGNYPLAAALNKQAAEEMGGAFTNRRELTGKDGKDLPAAAPAVAIFALPDNGREA
ncbi:MAG: DUF2280 domain-containing protein [Sphingobium sp.]